MRLWLIWMISAGTAIAGPISQGTWYEFGFDPNHAPVVSGCQPADPAGVPCRAGIGSLNLDAPAWTFTAPTAVSLSVTDGFLAGDSFSLFDFGSLVGSTPSVAALGVSCGFDPNVCLVNPGISHAIFILQPGSHSLTITVQPAQIQGEGFFRVQAAPEPSYLILVVILVSGLISRMGWRIRMG